jgi:hypothetical protein
MKKDDQVVETFRTKSTGIDALATKRLNDYLDAEKEAPGTYSFDMIVNFWNTYKMDTKTFHADLLTEEEYQKIKGNLGST